MTHLQIRQKGREDLRQSHADRVAGSIGGGKFRVRAGTIQETLSVRLGGTEGNWHAGTVKGYGFLSQSPGKADIFVHLERSGSGVIGELWKASLPASASATGGKGCCGRHRATGLMRAD